MRIINVVNSLAALKSRVGFYSPDKKWHLRNVTSDLFQWPLTGVAQVPLFDLVAFFRLYSGCCEGGGGGRSAVIG